MTSRGLNEYMSTVNAFGSNSQAAQNYAQNYRRKGEDALNTKMADWRAAGQAKAATILQAAQEKYEGQIAQGKEVVEASMGAYGAAKGLKAAVSTFKSAKAAAQARNSAEATKSLFSDTSETNPTASTLFGGEEESTVTTEAPTSVMDTAVSDVTSSDVPATDGFGYGSSQTGSSGFLSGDTPDSSAPVEGEAGEEAGEVAEGAGEAEEAASATSAFESASGLVTGATEAVTSGIADATAAATSIGEGLLTEAATTIGGDAVVGEALIAAGPEAILAAGAVAGVAYGINDLISHIKHHATPDAAAIAQKLPGKPNMAQSFVANSVNQAKSGFISGAFDSVNDIPSSVAAF